MKRKETDCSVCVNRNNEPVVMIDEHYYMCAGCVRDDHEESHDKIRRLENLLEYCIHNGL